MQPFFPYLSFLVFMGELKELQCLLLYMVPPANEILLCKGGILTQQLLQLCIGLCGVLCEMISDMQKGIDLPRHCTAVRIAFFHFQCQNFFRCQLIHGILCPVFVVQKFQPSFAIFLSTMTKRAPCFQQICLFCRNNDTTENPVSPAGYCLTAPAVPAAAVQHPDETPG